jgi:hypothetical protein
MGKCSLVEVKIMRATRSDRGSFRFTDAEIIERHSIPEPNSGCWIWLADTSNRWGYGRVGSNRRERLAHRLSYAIFRGPIPNGLKVLHRCDIACCVNPAHLFLGTDKDNMQDMQRKGRTRGNAGKCGEENALAKLTARAVDAIRTSAKRDAELARDHGVSRRAIRFVRGGKTWVQ